MKKILAAVAFVAMANTAVAQEPVMQADAIEAATSSSSHAAIVPLLTLLLVIAVLNSNGPTKMCKLAVKAC